MQEWSAHQTCRTAGKTKILLAKAECLCVFGGWCVLIYCIWKNMLIAGLRFDRELCFFFFLFYFHKPVSEVRYLYCRQKGFQHFSRRRDYEDGLHYCRSHLRQTSCRLADFLNSASSFNHNQTLNYVPRNQPYMWTAGARRRDDVYLSQTDELILQIVPANSWCGMTAAGTVCLVRDDSMAKRGLAHTSLGKTKVNTSLLLSCERATPAERFYKPPIGNSTGLISTRRDQKKKGGGRENRHSLPKH